MASLHPKTESIDLEAGIIVEGTIEGFHGSSHSMLAHIVIDGKFIPCDNGLAVRALDDCFGNLITKSRTYDENAIIGKRIKFSVDEKGAMAWFDSVDGPANELH